MTDPDENNHDHDADNQGVSAPDPAEGSDDAPGEFDGSPKG